MPLRWQCVNVDATEPVALGHWWAEFLRWPITYEDADEVVLEPPAGSPEGRISPGFVFYKVPESKTIKNRLHLDLRPDDQMAEVARAEALGARRVDVGQSPESTWVVLADPEGNEFCILRAFTQEELES